MERKKRQKKEKLLPTSLLEDMEYDELDKEMQSNQIHQNNEPEIKGISLIFNFFINL